ncbi:MAG: alpha/beta fold hydrolase [Nannocystaceae bacterium]
MAKRSFIRDRVQGAIETVQHSLGYARHLIRGNHVAGDFSWVDNARPLVLVHGFLGTRGTMMPLTRRFQADGRAVFTYHHGTFQLGSLASTAETLAAHIRSIVESLGIDRVDVVGFSMGGLVALHALKFSDAGEHVRRLVMMGAPVRGTWAALAGVATVGLISPSVWQVIPQSRFLRELLDAPLPTGIRIRQIHAEQDAFCPLPGPIRGVDPERDYIVLPGGHSSLVIAQPFYARAREFLDEADERVATATAAVADDRR